MKNLHEYKNPHTNIHYDFLKQCIITLPNYCNKSYNNQYTINEYCQFKYDVYEFPNKNTLYDGFFQTEKYFKKYRNELLKILKEPTYISTKLDSSGIDFEHGFFLHIRLTDYNHIGKCLPIEYYKKCINLLPKHINTIYVFSDDIIKAKQNLQQQSFNLQFIYIKESSELETLYSMARMRYGGICANSTFSWWGSWLNTSLYKLIYMPKPWFINQECIDIYPDYAKIIQY